MNAGLRWLLVLQCLALSLCNDAGIVSQTSIIDVCLKDPQGSVLNAVLPLSYPVNVEISQLVEIVRWDDPLVLTFLRPHLTFDTPVTVRIGTIKDSRGQILTQGGTLRLFDPSRTASSGFSVADASSSGDVPETTTAPHAETGNESDESPADEPSTRLLATERKKQRTLLSTRVRMRANNMQAQFSDSAEATGAPHDDDDDDDDDEDDDDGGEEDDESDSFVQLEQQSTPGNDPLVSQGTASKYKYKYTTPAKSPTKYKYTTPAKSPTKYKYTTPAKSPTKYKYTTPAKSPTYKYTTPAKSPTKYKYTTPAKSPTKYKYKTPAKSPTKYKTPAKSPTKYKSPAKSPTKYKYKSPSKYPTKYKVKVSPDASGKVYKSKWSKAYGYKSHSKAFKKRYVNGYRYTGYGYFGSRSILSTDTLVLFYLLSSVNHRTYYYDECTRYYCGSTLFHTSCSASQLPCQQYESSSSATSSPTTCQTHPANCAMSDFPDMDREDVFKIGSDYIGFTTNTITFPITIEILSIETDCSDFLRETEPYEPRLMVGLSSVELLEGTGSASTNRVSVGVVLVCCLMMLLRVA